MDRLQIAKKIEADARQFYKRYTAGLEILDDDLRMLTGFGVHLHNTVADQSRVIEVLTEALVKAQEHLKTHQHPFETAEYQHAVDLYNEIKVALAEAQRIQEGK